MGLWAKSIGIVNAIRAHGKQRIRRLAERTGLSKSSVHRHLRAMDRRDRHPESSWWETSAPGGPCGVLTQRLANGHAHVGAPHLGDRHGVGVSRYRPW
jgi:hypothetical protein